MGLQATLYARKDGQRIKPLIGTWARSTSEALAAALGLKSAYGVPDPEEPGNYLDETVDPASVRWDLLKELKGCVWKNGTTPDKIRKLVDSGWTLDYSPSY